MRFNLCVIHFHKDNIWLYVSIYQVINILGYVYCNFCSWVWIFLDLKFDLVCRCPRDMNFRINGFFELLLALQYDLFPCVDLDEFHYCTRPFWYYGIMVILVGQQSMSIFVIRLAWPLTVLWFSEIETSGLGKIGTVMNQQRYALTATWWGWPHVL